MSLLVDVYSKISYNFKVDYDSDLFINDLYNFMAKNDSYLNEMDNIYFNKFFSKHIFNDSARIVKKNIVYKVIEEAYSKVDDYTLLTFDQLLDKLSDLCSLEYQYNVTFLPVFIEFVRRSDQSLFLKIRQVLAFAFLDFAGINSYIINNFKDNLVTLTKSINLAMNICQRIIYDKFIKDRDVEISDEIIPIMKVVFFCLNKEYLDDYLGKAQNTGEKNIMRCTDSLLDIFKSRYANIYIKKYDFHDKKKQTLKSIGEEYGLSRERIRQIIKDFDYQIEEKLAWREKNIKNLYYLIRQDNDYPYLTLENIYLYLFDILKNEKLVRFIIAIMQNVCKNDICYDNDCKIFYDSDIFDISEFINGVINKYGEMISDLDYELCSDYLTKLTINANYNKKASFYIYKDLNIIAMVIKKYFPNGISVNQLKLTNDSKKLLNIISGNQKIVAKNVEKNDARSLYSRIIRSDVCCVAKGVFKARECCAILNDDLFQKIIIYINENVPAIRYETIFHQFKNELNAIGITNYYYLKGVLDYKIKDIIKYKCERDYININNLNINITKEIIDYLHTVIIKLFIDLNTDNLTSKAIFDDLLLNHYHILEKMPNIDDEVKLFSLIKHLFGNEFVCKKPIIATCEEKRQTLKMLPYQYVKKLNKFNYNDVNKYMNKMGIEMTPFYYSSQFMKNLANIFIQYDQTSMFKKIYLDDSNNFIYKLKQELKYYISSFSDIDTKTFQGYSLFPPVKILHINIDWNKKYLLIGLIRTFLNNEFKIKQKKDKDFIIRRMK